MSQRHTIHSRLFGFGCVLVGAGTVLLLQFRPQLARYHSHRVMHDRYHGRCCPYGVALITLGTTSAVLGTQMAEDCGTIVEDGLRKTPIKEGVPTLRPTISVDLAQGG